MIGSCRAAPVGAAGLVFAAAGTGVAGRVVVDRPHCQGRTVVDLSRAEGPRRVWEQMVQPAPARAA